MVVFYKVLVEYNNKVGTIVGGEEASGFTEVRKVTSWYKSLVIDP